MRRLRSAVPRIRAAAILLAFSCWAYVVAPFSLGDTRVRVPDKRELDAIQETLLVGSGMDRLWTSPRSYYDTAVLYPDTNQLRSTEPFLGFAVIGLPLRMLLGLNDVDVFEALRWGIVVICLVYAYLIFRALGIDRAIACAGAVLCVSQPDLVNGIDRLQIVSMPLLLPLLYHGGMAWAAGRWRDRVGVFVAAALYPLCGMINATVGVIAVLFILPLLLKVLTAPRRQERVAACLLPLASAAVLDALVLAPWWRDRADLAVYVSDAFLQIKHWSPMPAPGRLADVPGFVTARMGFGLAAALAVVGFLAARQRMRRGGSRGAAQVANPSPSQAYLAVVCVVAVGMATSARSVSGGRVLTWAQIVFQATCYATLAWYWRVQVRSAVPNDQSSLRNAALILSAGLGVFLCLMSFGPVYVSNDSPLASHITRMLLHVVPPLKSIREFHRIWIEGVLFASLYVTVRLGTALRRSAPSTRAALAVVIVAAAMVSVYDRDALATVDVEAPRDVVDLASHATSAGALYVHPYTQWNTLPGVWMIADARELRRPIVNGYLGIAPPWFIYAGNVLSRFPDPESVWLLRHWKVGTVVSVAGNVHGEGSAFVEKVFEDATGVVYGISVPTADVPHPSGGPCTAADGVARLDGISSPMTKADGAAFVTVHVPTGFAVRGVEMSFGLSVVEPLPVAIGLYAIQGDRRVLLNRGHSGEWIESLAADALVRRQRPLATIRLNAPQQGDLHIEFRDTETPPVERTTLCGDWAR